MCLPLILPSGDLVGVVEVSRNWEGAPYTPDLLKMAQVMIQEVNVTNEQLIEFFTNS